MTHNLHPKYGNAGYRFPRTTEEAFGSGATISVEEQEEIEDITNFAGHFAMVVYSLAAIVITYMLWSMK